MGENGIISQALYASKRSNYISAQEKIRLIISDSYDMNAKINKEKFIEKLSLIGEIRESDFDIEVLVGEFIFTIDENGYIECENYSINDNDDNNIELDLDNLGYYNFNNYIINSSGNYSITTRSNCFEKINIPIKNCIENKEYTLRFNIQINNCRLITDKGYINSCKVSNSIINSNENQTYNTVLVNNDNENSYQITFVATASTMYLNIDLSALFDDNTYLLYIWNSNDRKANTAVELDLNNPTFYNAGNTQIVSSGNYLMEGLSNKFEKMNIPIRITNPIIGQTYTLKFKLKIDNARYINLFSHSCQIYENTYPLHISNN